VIRSTLTPAPREARRRQRASTRRSDSEFFLVFFVFFVFFVSQAKGRRAVVSSCRRASAQRDRDGVKQSG
jgi:hypothetical protein